MHNAYIQFDNHCQGCIQVFALCFQISEFAVSCSFSSHQKLTRYLCDSTRINAHVRLDLDGQIKLLLGSCLAAKGCALFHTFCCSACHKILFLISSIFLSTSPGFRSSSSAMALCLSGCSCTTAHLSTNCNGAKVKGLC